MATFTATANSDSTIGYALYGSNEWKRGTENGACQGAYNGESIDDSRVGLFIFSGAGATLQNMSITEITLSFTAGSAGVSSSDRVLTLCKSKTQNPTTSINASDVPGDVLGTFTGQFHNTTHTFTLNNNSSPQIFAAAKAYLEAGNSVFVIFNGEYEPRSGKTTSYNYMRITSASLTVTYSDAVSNIIACGRKYIDGAWKKYALYTWDNLSWTLRKIGIEKPSEPVLTYITYPQTAMTANSSQSCVASSSSEYSSSFKTYYAFDLSATDAWAFETSDSPGWIQLQIPKALKNISVKVYAWSSSNKYAGYPVSGTLMGSTDGSSWTQIGSYSAWSGSAGELLGEIVCNNATAYNYIRFNVDTYTSGKSYCAVGSITITGGYES